jgi:hypothetical protein
MYSQRRRSLRLGRWGNIAVEKINRKENEMGKLGCCLAVLFCLGASPVFAQSNPTDDREVERSAIQTGRKTLIADNMVLTEAESKAFWPLYDEYQKELRKLNERRLGFIDSFAKDHEKMTDEKANVLMNEWLDIQKESLKVKSSYVSKFRSALPMGKVVRYFQIENKLEAAVDYELAKRIPLLK